MLPSVLTREERKRGRAKGGPGNDKSRFPSPQTRNMARKKRGEDDLGFILSRVSMVR